MNPTLTPAEFLEAALMDFGFPSAEIPASKAQRVGMLQSFLWARHAEGKTCALIVDEAHKLTPELIEEIRLLGNFESANEKLLQIVLVGQSELDHTINLESLRQFRQRISLRLTIEPLSEEEIGLYIRYRWMKASESAAPFSAEAIAAIGRASGGVPRVVNVLCDNGLLTAFGEGSTSVELRHVLAVCRELQFAAPVSALPELQPLASSQGGTEIPIVESIPMRSLARYETEGAKKSLLARLVGKLKFMQRAERCE
jgi:general secretion pathway protein A